MPAETDSPVLETIGAITAASLERTDLPDDALLMVRIAALAAMDARPVSYLAHVGPAVESGVTIEDVQNVLVAVARGGRIVGICPAETAWFAAGNRFGIVFAFRVVALPVPPPSPVLSSPVSGRRRPVDAAVPLVSSAPPWWRCIARRPAHAET